MIGSKVREIPLTVDTEGLVTVLRSGEPEECGILLREPESGRPVAVYLLLDDVSHLLVDYSGDGEWRVLNAWPANRDVVPGL